jgi:iron complex outermembrane receptor protein
VRASVFVQDDIVLEPNRASLVVGAKLERNDFASLEVQPNVRLRLTPGSRQTIWAAVSRAVRMPTRFDTDLRIRNPTTGRLLVTGTESFESESVVAYEAGYRVRPAPRLSLDVATFANDYDRLRSQEPPLDPALPVTLGNGLAGRTSGVELAGTATLARWWQAHGSYGYLWKRFSRADDSRDTSNGVNEGNDPSHLVSVRTSLDLPRRFQFDLGMRYVSRLPQPAVDAYTEMTARLGWKHSDRWELSVAGQNLLHDRHEEFAAGTPRELFERGVHVRSAWRF